MTKIRPRQLELPVMVDVNGKGNTGTPINRSAGSAPCANIVDTGFHKPASAGDQSVYKAISDNYFSTTVKQA